MEQGEEQQCSGTSTIVPNEQKSLTTSILQLKSAPFSILSNNQTSNEPQPSTSSGSNDQMLTLFYPLQITTDAPQKNNGIPDGWKACTVCDKIGIGDSFYGKSKLFCSIKCGRIGSQKLRQQQQTSLLAGKISGLKRTRPPVVNDEPCEMKTKLNHIPLVHMLQSNQSVNSLQMAFEYNTFAPVSAFANAPMRENWEELNENVYVDLRQPYREFYWRARIIRSYGYFVLVQYIGATCDSGLSNINIKQRNLLPVSFEPDTRQYCPPGSFRNIGTDALFRIPNNATTLKEDLYSTFTDSICNWFDREYFYEIIDPSYPNRTVCCTIVNVFGDWLLVRYEDGQISQNLARTAWVHPKSGFFRCMGWSQLIGYPIFAPNSYLALSLYSLTKNDRQINRYFTNPEMFPYEPNKPNTFPIGSYIELLDPFSHRMKIAMVVRKLRFGFMILEIEDTVPGANVLVQIFQHVTSPLIFPIGFSNRNKIPIYINNEIQYDEKKMFRVKENVESKAAPESCFPDLPNTNTVFQQGMILETFNLVRPNTVSYAMVDRVVDRLVSLRFFNYDPSIELWVENESPHIRPFGYSQTLQHSLTSSHPIEIDNIKFVELYSKIKEFKRKLKLIHKNTEEKQRKIMVVKPKPGTLSAADSMFWKLADPKTGTTQLENVFIYPQNPADSNERIIEPIHQSKVKELIEMVIQKNDHASTELQKHHRAAKYSADVLAEMESYAMNEFSKRNSSISNGKTNNNIDDEFESEISQLSEDSDARLIINDENNVKKFLNDNNEAEYLGYSTKWEPEKLFDQNFPRRQRCLELKKNIRSLMNPELRLDLSGLVMDPFHWTVADVLQFFKQNLPVAKANLFFNFPKNINGRRFMLMDNVAFHKLGLTMSQAVWIMVMKFHLLEHLGLDPETLEEEVEGIVASSQKTTDVAQKNNGINGTDINGNASTPETITEKPTSTIHHGTIWVVGPDSKRFGLVCAKPKS